MISTLNIECECDRNSHVAVVESYFYSAKWNNYWRALDTDCMRKKNSCWDGHQFHWVHDMQMIREGRGNYKFALAKNMRVLRAARQGVILYCRNLFWWVIRMYFGYLLIIENRWLHPLSLRRMALFDLSSPDGCRTWFVSLYPLIEWRILVSAKLHFPHFCKNKGGIKPFRPAVSLLRFFKRLQYVQELL